MKFKYIICVLVVFAFFFVSCFSDKKDDTITIKDGVYKATADSSFDDYVEFVEITIKDGKLKKVVYDGKNAITNESKKQAARDGKYKMANANNSKVTWDKQAEDLEKFAIQEINATSDKDWTTVLFLAAENKNNKDLDAISGVTIRIDPFLKLFEKAFDKATGKDRDETDDSKNETKENKTEEDDLEK